MFARKKGNKSGAVSVQVLTKANGASKLVGPIGRSNNAEAVERLVREGCRYITPFGGQKTFDFLGESNIVESAFRSISSHTEVGTELLLGKIFDEVGFDTIQDNTSRQLVSSRLTYPVSELKTRDYLGKYHDLDYPVQQSGQVALCPGRARSGDWLRAHKEKGDETSNVFYDVTTLSFEIDPEDELRNAGFSKEGKHQNPRIVLGLLVGKNGYPLACDALGGNKFEGHTTLPNLDAFKEKYRLAQLVIIAASGLLSNANIEELGPKNYEFILGARIKNEKRDVRRKTLSLSLKNGEGAAVKEKTV